MVKNGQFTEIQGVKGMQMKERDAIFHPFNWQILKRILSVNKNAQK